MAARFLRRTGYFDRKRGNFGALATTRAEKEERQGTMIVPCDPCGLLLLVAAGSGVLIWGWVGENGFCSISMGWAGAVGVVMEIQEGFWKFGCVPVYFPLSRGERRRVSGK